MHLTNLKVKNILGLTEFRLSEEDLKAIELRGDNGTGKSSVIDAIRYALTNSTEREYVIRNGATEGEILIETSQGLSINRKKREGRVDYKKITKEGQGIDRPESFLQEIFTELQLNPIEFIDKDAKEQNRTLLNLIKFDWTMAWIEEQFGEIPSGVNYDQNILKILHDIQDEKGFYYTTRHQLNTSAREKKAIREDILKDIPAQYNYKFWKGFDLDKSYERLNKAKSDNLKIEKCKAFQEGYNDKKSLLDEKLKNDMLNLSNEIAQERTGLLKIIQEAQNKLNDLDTNLDFGQKLLQSNYDKEMAELNTHNNIALEHANKELIDVEALENEVQTSKKMISYINEYERVLKVDAEIQDCVAQSQELTEKIEHARNLPAYVLENAEIPIDGLSVKDGIVLINGLPVSNQSEGEKLKLCIDIALNRKNNLNLLLIDGVEKLSEKNRTILYDKLKREGVHFIATRTTNDDELQIINL